MKINFDGCLKNIKGEVLKEKDAKGIESSVLVKEICVNALLMNEEKVEGTDKMKRFVLAKKIQAGGEIGLTAEEIVLVKEMVGKFYSPLVVGQIFELLDREK